MAQQGEVLQQQQTMIHTGMQPGVPPPGMGQPPPGMNQPPPGMNQPPPGAYPMGNLQAFKDIHVHNFSIPVLFLGMILPSSH